MKKYIVLIALALITMTGAVLEGLIPGLSPKVVQVNGLMTLASTLALIVWALSIQSGRFSEE